MLALQTWELIIMVTSIPQRLKIYKHYDLQHVAQNRTGLIQYISHLVYSLPYMYLINMLDGLFVQRIV